MREAFAVTGYVDGDRAKSVRGKLSGSWEIQADPQNDDVLIRIRGEDVQDARVGAEVGGRVLVQFILRDEASVETVIRHRASAPGLKELHDPTLQRLTASATAKVIMV
jgi:hypothetical protein